MRDRIILHVDYDSFFASVEQQANPFLRNKVVGVTSANSNKGIIVAPSIQAKRVGIKTGMPVFKARALYKNIILVKSDFVKYTHVQKESLKIFAKYTDKIEPFSIDEAFLDITQTCKFFGTPENVALEIKSELRKTIGTLITCSIGIGPNKSMAKIASEINKPNGIFKLTRNNMEEVYKEIELTDVCGIGKATAKKLRDLDINNLEDLAKTNYAILKLNFGNSLANFLTDIVKGTESSGVSSIDFKRVPKSMGHQHTLSSSTKDKLIIRATIKGLTELLARRLRKYKMRCTGLSLYIKDERGLGREAKQSFTKGVDSGQILFEILHQLYLGLNVEQRVRFIGIRAYKLESARYSVLGLFEEETRNELPKPNSNRNTSARSQENTLQQIKYDRKEALSKLLDSLNNVWGTKTIFFGTEIHAGEVQGKTSSFISYD
ncbi:DNA polymerase IV [Candidatus Nomurabacteria bacterium]|uniref:DNA polymerase IV n=1 Tax=candidate division WWE3 bacterium TaxID=2053526 RepID=A0A955E1Q7_UNCKA|nr:DNA polymerase IV [candidate division WWE3 bacterium]MCB9824124.1 DNA polymerase IV [Candidatus Nomurabacteria bacterium]MCB9826905.1 DNA polymerase IV [Candidatus Nomurabacteria bacterium]MCB9828065.1 DNA polymerase IV [Candidatus Nomurabacteria bacterium]HXK52881.1 DNA polymerase IV [bacterium]